MPDDIYIERNGRRIWLKWHRGRRRAADPVFTGRRILEGMALGASVEVDLVVHADHGMAVLHNLDLDEETTGLGLVRNTRADMLRRLKLRDNAGVPIEDRVMLLEDLAALIARDGAHPDAVLQLDYKEDRQALDDATISSFATAMQPVASSFILSSGDADAVAALASDVPGLRIGYDPCHRQSLAQLRATGDYLSFVADAIAASPAAVINYLEHRVVLAAADAGVNLIGLFHAAGRRIDAYTIQRADEAGVAIAERLLALKVDQITTDDPEGLGAALSQRAADSAAHP